MEIISDVITESEALRKCNLPSTSRWRAFMREKLPHGSAGNGIIYNEADVKKLAARIAEIPDELRPPEVSSTSTRTTRPDGLSDRRGPAVN